VGKSNKVYISGKTRERKGRGVRSEEDAGAQVEVGKFS
jgi:hypothetical protein